MTLASAIYVVVRGIDNWVVGLEEREKEKREQEEKDAREAAQKHEAAGVLAELIEEREKAKARRRRRPGRAEP